MAVRGYRDAKGRQRFAVEYQQRGVRVHERLPPGCTQAQAREWETKSRRELFDGQALGRKPPVLLSEVIQSWLDTKPHKDHAGAVRRANQLAPFLKGKYAEDAQEVAAGAVAQWMKSKPRWSARSRKGSGSMATLSDSTINLRLLVLKASLTWAHSAGMIPENYGVRIKLRQMNNRKNDYLTKIQTKEILGVTDGPLASAINIALHSGLRASEILSLTPNSLRGGPTLHITGKGGKPRVIPVPKSLLPALSHLPLGLSYTQLYRGFSAARKAAGLGPEVTLHTLRHTFASWLINAGVGLYEVSQLLGHSSVKMSERYAHLSQDSLRKAVGRLK